MNGDPKVIAALALAVLVLPPVVNAIMAKAADQADTDWLRDEPLDLDEFRPQEGEPRQGEGPQREFPPGEGPEQPRPQPRQPPPQCTPTTRDQAGRTFSPTDVVPGTAGQVALTTEAGDLAVGFHIEGTDLTGQPTFTLTEDGARRWRDAGAMRLREPYSESSAFPGPAPDVEWVLAYDLRGVAYTSLALGLVVQACAEAQR